MGAKFLPLFSASIPTHSMLVKLVLWSKQNKIRPAALFEMIRPQQTFMAQDTDIHEVTCICILTTLAYTLRPLQSANLTHWAIW